MRRFGNYYGTPEEPIDVALKNGQDIVFDVDWQGGDQIRESKFSRNVVSFLFSLQSMN